MLLLALPVASPAGAAGLGRLVVLSSLGEPFRAEIDLLPGTDERYAPVPRLAPPESWDRAGYHYHPALATARLTLRRHANGWPVIAVATEGRIEEPFLHLLVELQSGPTRILRGYVALLDPYGYGLPPAESVAAPLPAVTAAAAPVRARVTIAPAASAPAAAPAPAMAARPAAPSPQFEREIARLEEKLNAGAQALAGMLERVVVMEQAVAELRRGLEMRSAATAAMSPQAAKPPAAPAAPAPVAAKPAAPPVTAAADLPPRRGGGSDSLLNMALLVLGGGLVVLLVGLGYWMLWGRRSPAKT